MTASHGSSLEESATKWSPAMGALAILDGKLSGCNVLRKESEDLTEPSAGVSVPWRRLKDINLDTYPRFVMLYPRYVCICGFMWNGAVTGGSMEVNNVLRLTFESSF